jgi:hypothetical protein
MERIAFTSRAHTDLTRAGGGRVSSKDNTTREKALPERSARHRSCRISAENTIESQTPISGEDFSNRWTTIGLTAFFAIVILHTNIDEMFL